MLQDVPLKCLQSCTRLCGVISDKIEPHHTDLEHVEAVCVTQVPAANLRAHVPTVEWGRCKFEASTVEQHVSDSRERVPAQVQLLKPLEPAYWQATLKWLGFVSATFVNTCLFNSKETSLQIQIKNCTVLICIYGFCKEAFHLFIIIHYTFWETLCESRLHWISCYIYIYFF